MVELIWVVWWLSLLKIVFWEFLLDISCMVNGCVIFIKLKFGFKFLLIFFKVEKVCIIKVKVVGKWKGWL